MKSGRRIYSLLKFSYFVYIEAESEGPMEPRQQKC